MTDYTVQVALDPTQPEVYALTETRAFPVPEDEQSPGAFRWPPAQVALLTLVPSIATEVEPSHSVPFDIDFLPRDDMPAEEVRRWTAMAISASKAALIIGRLMGRLAGYEPSPEGVYVMLDTVEDTTVTYRAMDDEDLRAHGFDPETMTEETTRNIALVTYLEESS